MVPTTPASLLSPCLAARQKLSDSAKALVSREQSGARCTARPRGEILQKGGAMAKIERIYRRTDAGCRAWEDEKSGLPVEYRRILALVNAETHSDDIRRAVRRFSDEQIFSWLAEMETLGFVESEAVSSNNDLDFTGSLALSALAAALRS